MYHAMKAFVELCAFITIALDVNGQLHAPGKETTNIIGHEVV
jgi:hypothetical protein